MLKLRGYFLNEDALSSHPRNLGIKMKPNKDYYISDEGVVVEDARTASDELVAYILNHQRVHARLNLSLSVIRWTLILLAVYLGLTRLFL
jgi:hypothetical protein